MVYIELDKAKLQIDVLIQKAIDGQEVVITDNAKPVLKLVPVVKTKIRRKAGSAKGMISMSDDFDEPLEDFRDYI